jgi:hypothetical protein
VARYVVAGLGAVGARAARQLHSLGGADELWLVSADRRRAQEVASALGEPARTGTWDEALAARPDAVVLSGAVGPLVGAQRLVERARLALEAGAHVVTTSDGQEETEGLLGLDSEARRLGRHLVPGAAFCPGLSCVLALHAAARMDEIEEVRVSATGAGGPACRRAHRRSLSGPAHEWDAGEWLSPAAGSGRELCWFPDPAGGRDCYRAGFSTTTLLLPAFPSARRISARRSATRRERAGLPDSPFGRKAEGAGGAIRVEVVGHRDGSVVDRVLGAYDRPAVAAGAVAALSANWAVNGRLVRTGAGGLAEMVKDTVGFLSQLSERGVRAAIFTGTSGGG